MVTRKRPAPCHPHKLVWAREMCFNCYRNWCRANRDLVGKRERRIPDCHPDREHEAKGLCHECYRGSPEYKQSQREYAKRKAKRQPPGYQIDSSLRNSHGITREQRDAMVEEQGGLCAICRKPPSGPGNTGVLHVDHDHVTGRIRGMLCNKCNVGLGMFLDDPEVLANASQYAYATSEFRLTI